jgi:hypothetical protein
MIRGTTPTHTFNLPFDTYLIGKIKISYAQDGNVVLTKEKDDCTLQGNAVKVRLTQEETLKFNARYKVQIQVRVLTTENDSLASKIYERSMEDILEDGVLV